MFKYLVIREITVINIIQSCQPPRINPINRIPLDNNPVDRFRPRVLKPNEDGLFSYIFLEGTHPLFSVFFAKSYA